MTLAPLILVVGLGMVADCAWGGEAVVNSLGMKFVEVPGKKVLMCIHETRKGDYAAYAKESPKIDMSWKKIEAYGVPVSEGDDHPVVNVNWEDSVAFCEWLSKKEGKVYRLPTDREWSYAVGIGTKEKKGLTPEKLDAKLKEIYPWGKTWPPPTGVANLADTAGASKIPGLAVVPGYTDGFATTAPVMSFKPNKLGLYDLSGNVWEWCEDWYNPLRREKVLRGGSWGYDPLSLLSSDRLYHAPSTRDMYRGFRCVLVSP
jgi:formylglycine-generating enzyme required for sulfatase activity